MIEQKIKENEQEAKVLKSQLSKSRSAWNKEFVDKKLSFLTESSLSEPDITSVVMNQDLFKALDMERSFSYPTRSGNRLEHVENFKKFMKKENPDIIYFSHHPQGLTWCPLQREFVNGDSVSFNTMVFVSLEEYIANRKNRIVKRISSLKASKTKLLKKLRS